MYSDFRLLFKLVQCVYCIFCTESFYFYLVLVLFSIISCIYLFTKSEKKNLCVNISFVYWVLIFFWPFLFFIFSNFSFKTKFFSGGFFQGAYRWASFYNAMFRKHENSQKFKIIKSKQLNIKHNLKFTQYERSFKKVISNSWLNWKCKISTGYILKLSINIKRIYFNF